MVDQNRQLAALISSPDLVRPEDMPTLQELLKRFPYMQPLHLLVAKAAKKETEGGKYLATASLYCNGLTLHKFMHAEYAEIPVEDVRAEEVEMKDLPFEDTDPIQAENIPSSPKESIEIDEQETFNEIEEVDLGKFKQLTEDDLALENIVATDFFEFEKNFGFVENVEDLPGNLEVEPPAYEEDIVGQEHFIDRERAFEQNAAMQQNRTSEATDEIPADDWRVSKYDDDKLPYTFLWWLAKTRKEYQQIFQPYATMKTSPSDKAQPATGTGLQQQYVEHIFHIQTPFSAEEHLAPDVEHLQASGKGKEIIENFIKKDPQIQTPKPEQIDNENKAKKSAEDHNDLVSETLAKIYIEQMLYHKAIETYEKLSLKFPEKSRYFADLIQSINKKI
jgi:hypothetical protein